MASSHNRETRSISLRAPDEFISGLLSVVFATEIQRQEGDLNTFPEQSDCWYLAGVDQGGVRLTHEDSCALLEDGQAVAVSGESPMDLLSQGDGTLRVLCLKGSAASGLLQESKKRGGLFFPTGSFLLADAMEALKQEEAKEGSVPAPLASGIAYQLLSRLYGTGVLAVREEKQLPRVVEAALRVLQQDFAFLDGVGDLAARLHVSQEYLTRTFGEHVGMTPGKYLNQVRVEHAKLLLQQGDHSVAFVADACGFANSNYFARVFRTMEGMTPSQYAKTVSGQTALPDSLLDSFYVL